MFDRFTEASRAVLVAAQDLALELASPTLTPAHLLYGCAEVRDETAGRPLRDSGLSGELIRRALPRTDEQGAAPVDPEVLRAIGIDYDGVRTAVEQAFGAGALEAAPDRRTSTRHRPRPRFAPGAKQSIALALRVARELHDDRIRPGHLLLGLLRLDDGLVHQLVRGSGATVAGLSADVLAGLSTP